MVMTRWFLYLVAVGSKVVGAGGGNSGLVNGDNGAVGVSHQTVEASSVAGTVGVGGAGVHTADNTVGGQVVGTGSNHSGLVSGGHSAVGVGNQLGDMDGSSSGVGNGGHSRDSGNRGNGRGGSNDGSGSGVGSILGGQVV